MSVKRGIWQAINAQVITTTGAMAAGDGFVEAYNEVGMYISVGAITGGGSITFTYQLSPDNGTNWFDVVQGTTASISAVGGQKVYFPLPLNATGQFARVAWTVTGTFSATVSVWIGAKKADG